MTQVSWKRSVCRRKAGLALCTPGRKANKAAKEGRKKWWSPIRREGDLWRLVSGVGRGLAVMEQDHDGKGKEVRESKAMDGLEAPEEEFVLDRRHATTAKGGWKSNMGYYGNADQNKKKTAHLSH